MKLLTPEQVSKELAQMIEKQAKELPEDQRVDYYQAVADTFQTNNSLSEKVE